ncbi:hypothetical protein Dsin_022643 [Dipteronia sinensis]|uniref:Uncharacterized protein n=1 Tax=Dipteronia sinensis TaxID=43782 RepID=A0AAE0A1S2_9ROSI|nr:hypothetical protein Dsin_022643 [Dipteronia sinensis]
MGESDQPASGAFAGAVTDPTAQDRTDRTPAFVAASNGNKGLAGYRLEVSLTSHLSSLTLEESELSKGSAEVEAEIAVHSVTNRSLSTNEDQLSLKDTLAAVRNAAQAAARIQSAFRAHSFRKWQQKDAAGADSSIDQYGWKGRKDYLAFHKKVVKIQAELGATAAAASISGEPKSKATHNSRSEKTTFFLKRSINVGMPICEAFAQIEQQPNIYDVVHVKSLSSLISLSAFRIIVFTFVLILGLRVCHSLFQFPASIQIAAMTHDREDKKVGVGSLMAKAVTPPLPPGSLYMEEVYVKVKLLMHFLKA